MNLDYTVHVQMKNKMLNNIEDITTAFDKAHSKGKGTK